MELELELEEATLVRLAKHIIFVGLTNYTDSETYKGVASVIRSSTPQLASHEISFNLSEEYNYFNKTR